MNLSKSLSIGLGIIAVLGGVAVLSVGGSNNKESSVEVEATNPAVHADGTIGTAKLKIKKIKPSIDQIVYFNTPVTYASVDVAINALREIEEKGFTEAYIVLDSPGGSVLDGIKVINYIESSNITVHTVCDGLCASMAAQIHQVGKKRMMTPRSLLMFHDAAGGLQGNLEQMNAQLQAIRRYVARLDLATAKRSKLDYQTFRNDILASNIWIDSEDAMTKGLNDELVFLELPANKNLPAYDVLEMLKTRPLREAPERRLQDLEM